MSEVKVNKISPRTACGTVTLGDSGDTFTIPSGATITNNGTQTGFGRTGTVDWNTTKITADPANAVSGTGYFCDTSGGGFTVTLPTSPSAGDIVSVSDYTGTFGSNNLTIGRNSSNINGAASNFVIYQNNTSAQFIYVDVTEGWRLVMTGALSDVEAVPFVTATGGTPCSGATCGDFKVHTFTGPGTFCVSTVSECAANNEVSYIIVAGGGGGGNGDNTGGGGAGGFRESKSGVDVYDPASPLEGATNVTVSATAYPIVVGGGGPGGAGAGSCGAAGSQGVNSVFACVTSTGGGAGGGGRPPTDQGGNGGSGGGNGHWRCSAAGSGNTPPTSPAQGTSGGAGGGCSTPPAYGGGAGGGATVAGAVGGGAAAGAGGAGATTSITGGAVARAGGGGGGAETAPQAGAGGTGGGGAGGNNSVSGTAGGVNTGGGGGGTGGGNPCTGGNGGSGVVIIRYKFQ